MSIYRSSNSFRILGVLAALILAVLAGFVFAQEADTGRRGYVLTVDDAIGPATRDHIVRNITRAEKEGAEVVVLRLNTPGGLDASMRDIIRKILASEVPVVTWVAPAGSRAASAGTYIMYASHIAAMAPATNLGSATPVQIGGGESDKSPSSWERAREAMEKMRDGDEGANATEQPENLPEEPENLPDDAMGRKVVNDAVAYIKGLAERHARNAEWAERAVREAVSLTASEALEQRVVDVVAANLPELLEAIDGREVRMENGTRTLQTANLATVEIETDWRTELLAIITNPTLAYMLLMVGIYGLILEGYNPGAMVPGVIGGICLLLALYAFQILPVNFAGLALILLGMALIGVELFIPAFGILGIGGIVAVVAGSVILFEGDMPEFRINTYAIVGMGAGSALLFGGIVWVAARTLRKPRLSSREAMVGLEAEAIQDFIDGLGRVHLQGENWSARSGHPIRQGDKVRVIAMEEEGLVLSVTKAPTDNDKH
ncbi:NfeD family protein [Desulfomicrobium baculatum]|uniref:Nodulation efficiency protein NfeD n=1 Tax=Desulfomicrobium baculatum (strain DSM 4028 / VKM B-1378 / X) TaxID=525897 RepID=C7LUG0_DESBD|nr:nodulation protein NfeD [Desulfomicrobium baculatum]ACU89695.1 Nodulation efficiency protein NfeD [Desulfomicrobium baculatum DSM 4028]